MFNPKLIPIIGIVISFTLLTACTQGNKVTNEPYLEKEKPAESNFIFEETEFDLGTIKQSGGIVTHNFNFTYVGDSPIKITSTPGSCLCTKGSISKQEFNRGDKGVLTVEFDPNLHAEPKGKFFKSVAILTEPTLEKIPEVKVWTEINLDLGEAFFKLKEPHQDGDNKGDIEEIKKIDEISHSAKVLPLKQQKNRFFSLEAKEVIAPLDDGLNYEYWTYDQTVPGPLMRVREGDEVTIELNNSSNNKNPHSIDLHAVNGPGGGSVKTQVYPGESKEFSFKATHPGLYVYHCATPDVVQHVANGMYGMILVEPKKGFSKVDKEFYVMQGEIYSILNNGEKGDTQQSGEKLFNEMPEYIVFNGRKNALTKERALKAKVGDKIRLFVGNGGVSKSSNFHVIGEIFDQVYIEGGSLINKNVQTTTVPAGGATIVEFIIDEPGRYVLVDHALSRLNKGAMAEIFAI